MTKPPNSRVNLDRAINRFAGNPQQGEALRNTLANAIVSQMLYDGVVKGGSAMKFRYGSLAARATLDLDVARKSDLDEFLHGLRTRLKDGWNGFTGDIVICRQASPRGIPFEYVMQPCDVKLMYLGKSWYTVRLEVGSNEIGDADEQEDVSPPEEIVNLCTFLSLPTLSSAPMMQLEYQVAQKLHGVSAPNSKRAHDLIDLQLILAYATLDLKKTADICQRLFVYRKGHAWPAIIKKGTGWDIAYNGQRGALPVLPDVDAAIAWANDLIKQITNAS